MAAWGRRIPWMNYGMRWKSVYVGRSTQFGENPPTVASGTGHKKKSVGLRTAVLDQHP
jgi:hypothetical protein